MTLISESTVVLKSQLNRSKVSFIVDDEMTEKEQDSLPIVELKPFVHKVWRREKSYPTFYDRSCSVNATAGGSSARQSEVFDTVSEVDVVEESPSPPPRTAHSLPVRLPSQRTTKFENAFNDFKSQKEHFSKFVVDSGLKQKSRLHPQVDSINRKQSIHAISLIPGSFNRDDREKTTIVEITYGDSHSRSYSCSPKAMSPDDIKKQQAIRIKGEHVTKADRNLTDPPSPGRSFNGSWHSTGLRHGSPASMLFHNKADRGYGVKRPKTPLYDVIDRKGPLPSLQINPKSLKKRHSNKGYDHDPSVSEDYQDYREAYESNLRGKIGGIENSLKILNQHGAPTKVERQITFELEQNLSRLRKTKDYSPFEINPTEIAKFYSPPNFNLTHGEAMIRLGLHSNAYRRSSNKSRTSLSNGIPLGVSRSNDNKFARNLFKKTFGRLEELAPSYQKNAERTETNITVTADEDLLVLNDTPRSRYVSSVQDTELTHKNTGMVTDKRRYGQVAEEDYDMSISDGQTCVHVNLHSDINNKSHDSKTDGQSKNDVTSSESDEETNGHIESENEVLKSGNLKEQPQQNNGVRNSRKAGLRQENVEENVTSKLTDRHREVDASGRTFITSDNVVIT